MKGDRIMSKRKTGLLIALGAAIGAAAAGISYYFKYKSFNDELNTDFHDYEEEDTDEEATDNEDDSGAETSGRTYITLDSAKHKACAQEEPDKEQEPEKQEEKPADPPVPAATVEEDTEGDSE